MRFLIIFLCSFSFALEAVAVDPQKAKETKKLILPGESFLVENRPAFIMWPEESLRKKPQPWVFYAPTLAGYPDSHEMTPDELEKQNGNTNPIARMSVLSKAKLPAFIIHGDEDTVVPLKENSQTFLETYQAVGAGDSVTLLVVKGQGHNFWEGFFRCQALIDFVIERAKAGAIGLN